MKRIAISNMQPGQPGMERTVVPSNIQQLPCFMQHGTEYYMQKYIEAGLFSLNHE